MAEQHKHKGLERPNGSLRLHPVSQKHKDRYAQQCHNLALASAKRSKAKPKAKAKPKTTLLKAKPQSKVDKVKEFFGLDKEGKGRNMAISVDKDNYLYLDLTQPTDVKGVRLKFKRQEGRKKRTVGLQIEK